MDMDGKNVKLESELAELKQQVKGLVRAESRLYALQKELDTQRAANEALALLGREMYRGFDRDEIIRRACAFVVYQLNYERSAFLALDPSGTAFQVVAFDGQYGESIRQSLEGWTLDATKDLGARLREQRVTVVGGENADEEVASRAVASALDLTEAVILYVGEDASRVGGLLVAGNSAAQPRLYTRVGRGGKLSVVLSNLASLTATALMSCSLYEQIAEERNLLEVKVTERTHELSQTNQQLAGALAQAQESQRLKSEFLANVSHELRTPLNMIINLPEGLLAEFPLRPAAHCRACAAWFELEPGDSSDVPCPDCGQTGTLVDGEVHAYRGEPAETVRHLTTVVRCGKHLLGVVNDILDASKLEAGKMSLEVDEVDLRVILDDVAQTFAAQADKQQVALEFPRLSDEVVLEGDRLRLRQLLINLVGNALKFSHPGSAVTVSCEVDPLDVHLSVRDQGIGIAPADQELIFESFRQVEGGHTRRYGGSGLGLAISRQIVALHGGAIGVESALGRGSTFSVRLPRVAAAPRRLPPGRPSPAPRPA